MYQESIKIFNVSQEVDLDQEVIKGQRTDRQGSIKEMFNANQGVDQGSMKKVFYTSQEVDQGSIKG